MNRFCFNELKIGDSAQFMRDITAEMMQNFLRITGDNNPLHIDDEYAARHGFKARVCYGELSAAMFSTLAGVYLPGERCLLHSVESRFKLPVYIGDTLTVFGKITETNDTFKEIVVKARITNQDNKVVTIGIIKAGIRE